MLIVIPNDGLLINWFERVALPGTNFTAGLIPGAYAGDVKSGSKPGTNMGVRRIGAVLLGRAGSSDPAQLRAVSGLEGCVVLWGHSSTSPH